MAEQQIRLFIVDDHALFREGLLRLLSGDPGFELTGTAASRTEAVHHISGTAVDVLILDYDLGGGESAIDVVRDLRVAGFAGKTLLVTAGLPDREALELIRLGVSGIFHKQLAPEELKRSIREVHEGKALIDQHYLQKLVQAASTAASDRISLTERETRILRFLIEGLANKEIAAQLDISESAVKAALQQLFSRTGVRTRSQLVRIALEKYQDCI